MPSDGSNSTVSEMVAAKLGQPVNRLRLNKPTPCPELSTRPPVVWAITHEGCKTYDCSTLEGRRFTEEVTREFAKQNGFEEAIILAFPHSWRHDVNLEDGEFAPDEEHATIRFRRRVTGQPDYRFSWTCHLVTESIEETEDGATTEIWKVKDFRWGHHGDVVKLPRKERQLKDLTEEKKSRMANGSWRAGTKVLER